MEENLIKKYKLTTKEVLSIVHEWYVDGTYEDILQDEDGLDLEEILEGIYDDTEDEEKPDFELDDLDITTNLDR
jgi:hypothetical protein|tara:strand:+ start:581 stop:802 length:222 start_codon:yes stop_codon:yes gene_type:complete